MRTIISGPVTHAMITDAPFEPTSFVTNGRCKPPALLPLEVYPICEKQPVETSEIARDYTLVQNADALILAGENDHLYNLARAYDLQVFAPDYETPEVDLFASVDLFAPT